MWLWIFIFLIIIILLILLLGRSIEIFGDFLDKIYESLGIKSELLHTIILGIGVAIVLTILGESCKNFLK